MTRSASQLSARPLGDESPDNSSFTAGLCLAPLPPADAGTATRANAKMGAAITPTKFRLTRIRNPPRVVSRFFASLAPEHCSVDRIAGTPFGGDPGEPDARVR